MEESKCYQLQKRWQARIKNYKPASLLSIYLKIFKQFIYNNVFDFLINFFRATGFLLYSLKTENLAGFAMFLGGIERDQWNEIGEWWSSVIKPIRI